MRIAIVSDIHGNLMALDAVMADLAEQSPDEVWCAGDLAWGGLWPSECIARVRGAGWVTIRGNTDVWVTGDPQAVEDESERAELAGFALAHDLSEDDKRWLIELPFAHQGPGGLLMVHGTPESTFTAPLPDSPAADFAPYEGKATLVVYGHVHRAFIRRLADGTLVANPGSVGWPMDDRTASYLIIDRHGADLILRHRRVPFDRRAVLAQARRLGGPIGQRLLADFEP